MEDFTPVNDGLAGVEGQQTDTTAPQGNEGAQAAPATQQPSNVQTPEENSKFAQLRRDYEARLAAQQTEAQRAIDAEYARLYGEEYGVKSKADYERLVAGQQFKQQYGIDRAPLEDVAREEARRLLENTPELAELRQMRNEQQYEKDLKELQALDPTVKTREDLWAFATRDDVLPLITERGMTPAQVYKLVNHDRLVAEAKEAARVEALKSVQRNGEVSPGPVGGGSGAQAFYTEAEIDRMSTKEIMANYDAVMSSIRRNQKG